MVQCEEFQQEGHLQKAICYLLSASQLALAANTNSKTTT